MTKCERMYETLRKAGECHRRAVSDNDTIMIFMYTKIIKETEEEMADMMVEELSRKV